MSAHGDISEKDLLQNYKQSQDQKWVGQLYEPYMSLLYGVCMKYLKDPTLAKDAVMDIYIHISEKLKTHEVEKFRPWLYVVAKNHCYEQLRKSSKRIEKEISANDVYSETIFHPDSVSKETRLLKMEHCIEKLNMEQKSCVQAFYFKSMSYERIAQEYNLKWNTVRSHIQNGRRKLKICMDSKSEIKNV